MIFKNCSFNPRNIFLLVVMLCVTACNTDSSATKFYNVQQCLTTEEKERLAKFVVECKASDEDSVYACRNVGLEILCPVRTFKATTLPSGQILQEQVFPPISKTK